MERNSSMNIGSYLPRWRAAHNPPMSRMALKRALQDRGLAISLSTLCRIEHGQSPVTTSQLCAFMSIFSLTIVLPSRE